ncbi:hypothetical protein SNOG_13511 [Parastagonospora nodorum SN15]|uniref:Protein kinase domain-containing protein n=1 Tax=Phaeosphaeria nodorum (strain SN15 / ATCC MYA-4574 / FGSC 10173) TaxID=321614 RepID=Q0U403_PHANO|nr:hypothetical protein SNOG_13511 [Parastagonospora nodorum SN15]EAT78958.2 hypothetical protein SNOG_13511 [Parastagonospora nodorum SN15]
MAVRQDHITLEQNQDTERLPDVASAPPGGESGRGIFSTAREGSIAAQKSSSTSIRRVASIRRAGGRLGSKLNSDSVDVQRPDRVRKGLSLDHAKSTIALAQNLQIPEINGEGLASVTETDEQPSDLEDFQIFVEQVSDLGRNGSFSTYHSAHGSISTYHKQNWSGRGQHVVFKKHEQESISKVLQYKGNLGSTNSAIVQSVKCRRILLARKTIICSKRNMTQEEAIAEVSHLSRLAHAHIIRFIGTYVHGRELSILLYPVADYNLRGFLDDFQSGSSPPERQARMSASCTKFYSCLSSAVLHIHRNLTKHMDIKPQNVLVQERTSPTTSDTYYHIFIADFGISRSYEKKEEVETDGYTSFTRRYAAPEVVRLDRRGWPADIFSLGCVFFEIHNTMQSFSSDVHTTLEALLDKNVPRDAWRDTSFQANIAHLQSYLSKLATGQEPWMPAQTCYTISSMLNVRPQDRPTAEDLVAFFGEQDCCTTGVVQLEATKDE